jgi:hypothetical protein
VSASLIGMAEARDGMSAASAASSASLFMMRIGEREIELTYKIEWLNFHCFHRNSCLYSEIPFY